MNLVVLGPPGAGKGTQAKRIQERWGLIQLSTGEILRDAVDAGDEIGVKAEPVLAAGNLVPDEIVIHVVAERLKMSDCRNGFMLDGFPRTTVQAQVLDDLLKVRDLKIDAVIQIVADETALAERITGRYACSKCGVGYHDKFKVPKVTGICDIVARSPLNGARMTRQKRFNRGLNTTIMQPNQFCLITANAAFCLKSTVCSQSTGCQRRLTLFWRGSSD
jgi:adenylate kinase